VISFKLTGPFDGL